MTFKSAILNPIKEMTRFEKWWLGIFSLAIMASTLLFSITGTNYKDPINILVNWVFSPLSALCGCISVVLCARGSIWNIPTGIVNVLFYSVVAYYAGYYGDFLINAFFFLPSQYFVYRTWKKNLTINSDIVKMKRMNLKQTLITTILGILLIFSLGLLLREIDGFAKTILLRNQSIYTNVEKAFGVSSLFTPVLDASTEFTQIAGQILMVLRFAEQWFFWILTDIIAMIMWGAVIVTDPTSYAYSVPTFIMWLAWTLNAVYGLIIWYKKSKLSD